MTKTVSHLLHDYGAAKFGELWTPRKPDDWLDGDEGQTLRDLISNNDASNPETARLLNKLGVSLFCDKWRPGSAVSILGEDGAAMVRDFLEADAAPARRM